MLAADDIDYHLKGRQPYKHWLREQTIHFETEMEDPFSISRNCQNAACRPI